MELDITGFFNNAAPKDYSASRAEIGDNAGKVTWKAACDDSTLYNILDTDDKKAAFKVYMAGFGAWEEEEIEAMSATELNALCIQLIAGDIREAGLDTAAPDWEAYEADSAAGRVTGNLLKGIDCKIYYSISD